MTAPVLGNVAADHPAKWSTPVLDAMAEIVAGERERVGRQLSVLDPFAGIGRLRLYQHLRDFHPYTPTVSHVVGVELQPEWCVDDLTIEGSAAHLPGAGGGRAAGGHWATDWTGQFDAVVTSPCYGNRLADHHQAGDSCKKCKGTGQTLVGGHPLGPAITDGTPCKVCKGSGLSWRNTYAHALRRHGGDLVPGSAAGMLWGPEYRALHRLALAEMIRVVVPGGLLAINMSNHLRTEAKGAPPVEQLVVEWWLNEVILAGCRIQEVRRVGTSRNRKGANGQARVDGEVIIVAHTPTPRRLV